MRRRGVSEIIAAIIIVGIALSIGGVVSSYLLGSIRNVGLSSSHLLIKEADIEPVAGSAVKVTLIVENPTKHLWNATITGAILYYDGFRYKENLSIALNGTATSRIVLHPREVGELSALIEAPDQSVGVLDVIVRFTDTSTGVSYTDHVLTQWITG